jgi:uncharacterized membrane protein
MEKNFIRVRSAKDIFISFTLSLSGIALVVLPTSTGINILGFFLLLIGILLSFTLKSSYKDEETGIKYSKKERYFEGCRRDELSSAISNRNCKCKVALSEENKGNSLRLDIYYSRQAGKAYMQVFEYIPYKYEPYSNIYEHEIANVTELIEK